MSIAIWRLATDSSPTDLPLLKYKSSLEVPAVVWKQIIIHARKLHHLA
jgi:hypothetical protein